ncbi:N-acetylmuramoyl-L-alanine amidase [uncultured Gammaproteobacteria bacterium]
MFCSYPTISLSRVLASAGLRRLWSLGLLMLTSLIVSCSVVAAPAASAASEVAVAAPAVSPAAAHTVPGDVPTVIDARLGQHPDKTRFVLEVSGTVDFRAMAQADPYRIVIDLPELVWPEKTRVSALGLVRAVRYEPGEAGAARVVLVMSGPAKIRSAYVMSARDNHRPRLVLDIGETSTAAFLGEIDKPYGTRSSGRTATAAATPAVPIPVQPVPPPAPTVVAEPPAPPPAPPLVPAARPTMAGVPIHHSAYPPGYGQSVSTLTVPAPSAPAPSTPASPSAPAVPGAAASAAGHGVMLPVPPPSASAPSASAPSAAQQLVAALVPSLRPPLPQQPVRPPPGPTGKPMVVIDPGHGGNDPGATGRAEVHEKDITLAIARELRRQLEATGRFRVALTRDSDVFIRLRDRVAKAREQGAELFISLHADSIIRSAIHGVSIYTLSDKASDREAGMLAAKENRADAIGGINLASENDQVASILIDLVQRETRNHSHRLSSTLLREIGHDFTLLNKPNRSAGFAVLTAPDVPSVLIEMGYLTSPQDSNVLTRPELRERLAAAIARGVDRYFVALPRGVQRR